MSGSAVTMFSRANDTPGNNIAAKESPGHKKRENVFSNSFIGTKAGGVSYVNSSTRSTNDKQGTILSTGVASDLAVDGEGMLVVSNSATGEAKYTRRGDFRQDELGYWKNGSGQLLQAWKLDAQGNRPQNSSLLSSMESVNFANTKGLPVQTSVISIAMNLNADQKALRGPGPENGFVMQRSGNNKTTKPTDMLLPDQIGTKGLRVGDEFTFTSSAGKAPRTVSYGGITMGNKVSGTAQAFGATAASGTFIFGLAAAPGVIVDGQQIRIAIDGGSTYTFTAMSGQPTGTNFNSVQTLANAINKISSLHARVIGERLYIAPKDANKGMTYTNVGGGTNIVETLGLRDLPAAAVGENRFNSLRTLRDAVNTNRSEGSLLATIEGNNIKITSLLSNSTFRVQSNQVAGHQIAAATVNPQNNAVGGGTVLIDARDNNLQAGDLVRISGMVDPRVPNGVYSVGTSSNNGFTINIVGGAVAYIAPQADLVVPAAATWQIASGVKAGEKASTITQASAAGDIQITSIAHGYGNGDIIYTSGGVFELNNVADVGGGGAANKTITLPAGYYTVANSAANTFELTPTGVAAGGAGAGAPGLNFRKVGIAGAVPFNTTVFTTGAIGSTLVDYHVGNDKHGYAVGSTIRFADVGAVFDGITLAPDTDYVVTTVAPGVITFDVADDVGAGVAAAGGQVIDLATQATVKLDNHSRLFDYFGLDPQKTLFGKTYNPIDVDKNLTGGNFALAETFSHPLTIHDSLGSSYTVLLHFAKLEDNKWAVELAAQPDENGVFDIEGLIAQNGLIQSGIIEFNEDGTFNADKIIGFDERVNINRPGRAQSSIMIDFSNKLSDITSGTVSQVKSKGSNVEIVQSDGQAPGTLLKLSVTPDGFIIGTFDSGETRNLYQIPVALFANVNGLVAGANGTFDISRESGELLLKQAGAGGAGRTLGGVIEASNVDVTEELLLVQELGNTVRANARVAASTFKNVSTVLSELNN